ncbi:hypothetical protein PHLGIDRAFT_238103 [Phlebiopsis gigantea 11061_1 CR5-6]|uniref:Uncharacterized protein n=1 Tax=Phlebiopsis gigantea (strain 11061_1 CR5-6) TaxID=745531 RepID=A0A0C3S5C3_PHLG1|nr:hypothetical protein PHLGIDRAFT_238103 [Phlebiopsis gigantea 11061_1 CR5-6]
MAHKPDLGRRPHELVRHLRDVRPLLRGHEGTGPDRSTLPFVAPLQSYLGWYAVSSTLIICIARPLPLLLQTPHRRHHLR